MINRKIEIDTKTEEQFEALIKIKEGIKDNYNLVYDDDEDLFYLDDMIGQYVRSFRAKHNIATDKIHEYCKENKQKYIDFMLRNLYFVKVIPFENQEKAVILPAIQTRPDVETILNVYKLKCSNIEIDFDKKRMIVECIPERPLFFTQSKFSN